MSDKIYPLEEFANFGGEEDDIGDEQAHRLLEEEEVLEFDPTPDLQLLLEVRPGDHAVAATVAQPIPAGDRLVSIFIFI